MGDTDTAWETWGQTDPYFGVVSHGNYRQDQIDEHRDEFFASGDEVARQRLEVCERIFGPLERSRALDFGCGVGRLTLPLAQQFESVVGVDISPAMLAEARRNAEATGAGNVEFVLSDDTVSNAPGQFAFVNTYIVLQHIPTSRGMAIIRALIDKVAPGGGFALHVSVHTRGTLWRLGHWAVHHVPLADKVSAAAKGRSLADPTMQMNGYPLQEILVELARNGIPDVHLMSETHSGVMTFSLIGRKPYPA